MLLEYITFDIKYLGHRNLLLHIAYRPTMYEIENLQPLFDKLHQKHCLWIVHSARQDMNKWVWPIAFLISIGGLSYMGINPYLIKDWWWVLLDCAQRKTRYRSNVLSFWETTHAIIRHPNCT
jgi:hypothetical protein